MGRAPPSPAQIPFYLGRAYNEANTGRKGPVHLTIPVDVFTAQTDQCSNAPEPLAEVGLAPDPRQITQTIAALKSARHPVIIAGSGIWWADACDELRQFVELTSLPVYTITMAKGAISDEHPLCLGYADPALNKAVHKAFKEADLFLVLGKRIDYRLALGGSATVQSGRPLHPGGHSSAGAGAESETRNRYLRGCEKYAAGTARRSREGEMEAAAVARTAPGLESRVGRATGRAGPQHDVAAASGRFLCRIQEMVAEESDLFLGWRRRGPLGTRDSSHHGAGPLAAFGTARHHRRRLAKRPRDAACRTPASRSR